MAQYSTSFEKSGGYSFDQQAIADLWKQAKLHTGKTAEASVSLEGDHNIRSNDVDELFEDPFVQNNSIERIAITSHDYGETPSKTISILLRKDSILDAVSVSISGNRADCSARLAEIVNIVDGKRVWYAKYIFPTKAWFGMIILGIFSALIGAAVQGRIEKLMSINLSVFWAVVTWISAYLFLTVFIALLKWRMFPKIVFEVGKSAQFGRSAVYWRNIIGVAVLLAIVVGVVSGIIVEYIK